MQSVPPCPAPTHWWQMQVSGLLLHWQLWLDAYSVGLFSFFLFVSSGYVILWDSKIHHRPACERVSYCVETSPPSRLPPQEGPPPLNVLSLFLSFIFCQTSFQREWADFWVPGVLHQRSEAVLWKLLNIQMIFWWIFGREICLPILFLHHLWTTSSSYLLKNESNNTV